MVIGQPEYGQLSVTSPPYIRQHKPHTEDQHPQQAKPALHSVPGQPSTFAFYLLACFLIMCRCAGTVTERLRQVIWRWGRRRLVKTRCGMRRVSPAHAVRSCWPVCATATRRATSTVNDITPNSCGHAAPLAMRYQACDSVCY